MLASRIRRVTIDTRARSFEIETVDGRIHQEPAAFPAERGDLGLPPDFHLISYNTAERTLTLTPPDGEALVVEVFDGSNQSERRGAADDLPRPEQMGPARSNDPHARLGPGVRT